MSTEKQKAYQKAYYQDHRDELRARHIAYNKAHPEKAKVSAIKYQETHKEESLARQREYDRQIKLQVFIHYSGGELGCAVCRITDLDVLCIDHIDGGGNKHRRQLSIGSGKDFYRWLINKNYPEGFQVLCANCNLKKQHLIKKERR